jgi:hypothetical protein
MDSMGALEAIPVSGGRVGEGDGQLLTNVATIERGQGPTVVSHYNVLPVVDVFGNISGRDLGGVIRDIQPLLEEAKKELPRGSSHRDARAGGDDAEQLLRSRHWSRCGDHADLPATGGELSKLARSIDHHQRDCRVRSLAWSGRFG